MSTTRTKSRSSTEHVTKEKESFTLQLPTELDPKPDWIIAMPAGHTVEVFRSKLTNSLRRFEADPIEVDGFRIVVRNRHGALKNVFAGHQYHASGVGAYDVLSLRNELTSLAEALMPKVKRVVVEDETYD